jgi:hypothetical protein
MKVFTYVLLVFLLVGLAACQPRISMESQPWEHMNRIPARQANDFFADSVRGYDKDGSPVNVVRSLSQSVPVDIYAGQAGSVHTLVFHTADTNLREFPEQGILVPYPELRTRLLGKVIVLLRCSDPDLSIRLREACVPYLSGPFMEFFDADEELPFPKLIDKYGGDFLLVLGTNGTIVISDEGDLQGSERRLVRALKKEFTRLEYAH